MAISADRELKDMTIVDRRTRAWRLREQHRAELVAALGGEERLSAHQLLQLEIVLGLNALVVDFQARLAAGEQIMASMMVRALIPSLQRGPRRVWRHDPEARCCWRCREASPRWRSQVAEKSRELAEMNERLMAFGNSLLAALGRTHALFLLGRRDTRAKKGRSTGSLSASPLQLPSPARSAVLIGSLT